MPSTFASYLNAFQHLNTNPNRKHWPDKTMYRSPYKPLLLMAIMDAVVDGSIRTNFIELTPELIETFAAYVSLVIPGKPPSLIFQPFFHLSRDGFWHLVSKPGVTPAGAATSLSNLQETYLGAKLDEDLFQFFMMKESREQLRLVLLQAHFQPQVHALLLEQAVVNNQSGLYTQALLLQSEPPQSVLAVAEVGTIERTRDQGFRRAIVRAYAHRCAFCGVRILTIDGHTAVDAAHIKPWSEGGEDYVPNGIALCKLCHWSFDEGLTGLTTEHHIKLSPQLNHGDNQPGHLTTLTNREILGPERTELWPDPDAIRWHSRHIFRSR